MIVTINGAPNLSQVKSWLGLDPADTGDDVVLQKSLDAALAAQARVCRYPCDEFGDRYFSDDLVEAIYLRTQRLASRQNSPSGVLAMQGSSGDFVAARVPSGDPDVLRLEGPYLKIPVA